MTDLRDLAWNLATPALAIIFGVLLTCDWGAPERAAFFVVALSLISLPLYDLLYPYVMRRHARVECRDGEWFGWIRGVPFHLYLGVIWRNSDTGRDAPIQAKELLRQLLEEERSKQAYATHRPSWPKRRRP